MKANANMLFTKVTIHICIKNPFSFNLKIQILTIHNSVKFNSCNFDESNVRMNNVFGAEEFSSAHLAGKKNV